MLVSFADRHSVHDKREVERRLAEALSGLSTAMETDQATVIDEDVSSRELLHRAWDSAEEEIEALQAELRLLRQRHQEAGHIERFNPAIAAIKQLLKAPRYVQAERSAPFTVRCTDVNVVLDLMIHDLDIVADVAGSKPSKVSAMGTAVITREIDSVIARIVFENGCIADVAASRVSDEKKRVIRIFDGDRLYTADYQTQKAFVSRRGTATVPDLVTNELPSERRDTLLDEIRSFIASIESGKPPQVGGTEGRNALALARLITHCIEQGTTDFVPFS